MAPGDFIAKWRASEFKERSAAQEHFIDLCRLLDEPTPAEADPAGERLSGGRAVRAGLVATDSIRSDSNRRALQSAAEGRAVYDNFTPAVAPGHPPTMGWPPQGTLARPSGSGDRDTETLRTPI